MSFGFGGGGAQGTVRYALMVDDAQATRAITTFKSNVSTLNLPTSQLTSNMGKLNQTFNAGVTPIKTQGSALTNLNNNLKTTGTTATTLGSKIKTTAGQFAGFATGLGVTASGVLQLAAGFRDYNDAQIAVDRVQRKLSLATEAQGKAVDKLNALTAKGVKSGKDYQQAQLDVQQAQAAVSIQTDLLGEAQERMFDSQTQFVASVVPITLGAMGTLGSAFKDLGLNTEKITGGLGKLKGGLGSLSGSLGMSTKSFLGMSTAIGGAAFAAADLFDLLEQKKKLLQFDVQINAGTATVEQLQGKIDQIKVMKGRWDTQLFDFFKSGPIGKAAFGDTFAHMGDEVIKSLESQIDKVKNQKSMEKLLIDITNVPLPPSAKAGVQKTINEIIQIYKDPSGKNFQNIDFTKTTQGILDKLFKTLESQLKSGTLGEGLTGAMLTAFNKVWHGVQAGLDLTNSPITRAFAIDPKPIAASLDPIGKLYKATMDKIVTSSKTGGEFTRLFGDAATIAAEKSDVFRERIDHLNTGMTGFEGAIQAGVTQFQTLDDTTKNSTLQMKAYREQLIASVGSQLQLPPGLELTTEQLAAMQTGLSKATIDIAGMSDATKVLADAMNNELAPAMKTFDSAIKADKWNDFKKAFKDIPGVGDFSKHAREDLRDLIGDFRKVGKAAQEVGTDISAAILGAFEGIDSKSLKSFTTNLRKDIGEIAKIDIDATKFKPITDFLDGLTKENRASGILKIKDSLALMQDAMADGNVTAEEAAAVIAKFNEETGKTAAPTNSASAAVKAFGVSSASARGEIDAVTGAIDVLAGQAAKIHPTIIVNNDPALKAIDVIAKRIDSLEKLKPQISLVNTKAIKTTDVVAKRIDSLEKIKPQISLQNKNAIKSVDVVAKRIQGLENINPTIKVKFTGSGTLKATGSASLSGGGSIKIAQHGMHELLRKDTTIVAHAGERVDIGKPEKARDDRRGGGVTSGDLTVNNHIDLGGTEIIRSFKRKLGTNRFTLG